MASNVRFVDQISVSSYGDRTGTSVSSSYATSASYADTALSASYAISASHEIIKEVSSSHADTASYVETAQTASYVLNAISSSYSTFAGSGNGIFSGSFSGSLVGPTSSSIASDINTNLTNINLNTNNIGANLVSIQANTAAIGVNTSNININSGNILSNTNNITSLTNATGSYATTGSNNFIGDQDITGDVDISGRIDFGDGFIDTSKTQFHMGLGSTSTSVISTQRNIIRFKIGTNSLGAGGTTEFTINNLRTTMGASLDGPNSFLGTDSITLYMQNSTPDDNYIGITRPQSLGYFATNDHRLIGLYDLDYSGGSAGTTLYFTSGSSPYKGLLLDNTGSINIQSGSLIVSQTASAAYFVGDGSNLTGVISSSYADTASFAQSGDGIFSGSFSGSFVGNGSNLTGVETFPFSGSAVITGSLTVSGSFLNPGTVSIDDTDSPYTLTGTQQFVLIDPSGGNITINIPDAATYPGREIKLKLTQAAGANTVTLQRQGLDTIDGANTYTDLDIQYEAISIVSDGSNGWFIF